MSSEHALRSLLAGGAAIAALGGALLFLVEVARGLAARRGPVPRALARLGRRSPRFVRRLAEVTVTALLAIGAARPAGASATPIRDWLTHSPPTTTTATTPTPAPVADPVPTTASMLATATTSTTTPAAATPRRAAPVVPAAPAPGPGRTTPSAPSAPAAVPAPAPSGATYVVRPGDCLWRVAAQLLGPGASNAAIDAGWRALYAANRASIGDDPGLIHPGLVLALPPLPVAR